MIRRPPRSPLFPFTTLFFFNDTATTEIYTLSLHDALPIYRAGFSFLDVIREVNGTLCFRGSGPPALAIGHSSTEACIAFCNFQRLLTTLDRKSTRLNSSHANISYAVFCLKKKKNQRNSS